MAAAAPPKPLAPSFYRRGAVELARALLGKLLLRRHRGTLIGGYIVEVEAYLGESDPASHAAMGRTARNSVMYGPGGHAYVYFTYGMHHCVNVVAGRNGVAEAVLIRSLEPAVGVAEMRRRRGGRISDRDLARGPARLARALGLDMRHNGLPLGGPDLIVARGRGAPRILGVSARVGIRVGLDQPWRFYDAESRFVSPGRPGPPGRRRGPGKTRRRPR